MGPQLANRGISALGFLVEKQSLKEIHKFRLELRKLLAVEIGGTSQNNYIH